MPSDVISRMKQTCQRLFAEREIYYRSGGEFRFVSITRRHQIAGSVLLAAAVVWSGYAITGLVMKERAILAKDARIARIAGDYDLLSEHLRQVQNRLLVIARELEVKHKVLDSLSQQNSTLHGQVDSLSDTLDRTSSELNAARANSASLEKRRSALKDSLDATEALVDTLAADRNMALQQGEELKQEVVALQSRLGLLESAQEKLVTRIEKRTDLNISELESVIEDAGLDVDEMLRRVEDEGGVGGPFVDLASTGAKGDAFADYGWLGGLGAEGGLYGVSPPLDRLEGLLVRWAALNQVVEQLPLTTPVESFWISSTFGKRRDPMSKRWAMHYGIDMAGPSKQPVYSTAAGTVTYAGWHGPYGRMVEIDHGYGIKTRYGHLRRIVVEKGQQVGLRQKIGLMGSSGRSTGSHVHYEIHFDDTPIDPSKLIEAGAHAVKDQKAE